ncbi:YagK/YfjJ domain-containing protein [Yersinia vastinensis]|uniref:YagK/YfjJ domain-containing protein n=1 Tax=Yersinia vastinensis TaxID=2890318 RepID=UPI0011A36B84|nr:inovirus-type Gp2 protein [Yersinia vastinensis]
MQILNEELTDAQRIHRVLQAAIDHYPRLAAFRFSLRQPDTDALFLPAEAVLKFVNTLQRMINGFIDMRHGEGKAAPPTILRVLWGMNASHDLQMLLLLNHSTFSRRPRQEEPEAVLALIRQAWVTVNRNAGFITEPAVLFSPEPCLLAHRAAPDRFAAQYDVLRNVARQLSAPVNVCLSNMSG